MIVQDFVMNRFEVSFKTKSFNCYFHF